MDYNDKLRADIPMQRKARHRFVGGKGLDDYSRGAGGRCVRPKVRTENRDRRQIIKEHAKQGRFDILLVFMFDRIGRIADKMSFSVERFVKNGVRAWSTQEGGQRFDNHTDKRTNYIGMPPVRNAVISRLFGACTRKKMNQSCRIGSTRFRI